jgi:hypothetical protein
VKVSAGTLVVITALALGIWTFFYVFTPSTPLDGAETFVVVGVSAVLVLGAKWVWARLRRPGEGHASKP